MTEAQAIEKGVEALCRPRVVKTGKISFSAVNYATRHRNELEVEYSKRSGKKVNITMSWMYKMIIEDWCARGLKLKGQIVEIKFL